MLGAEQLLEALRGLNLDCMGRAAAVTETIIVTEAGAACRRSLLPLAETLELEGVKERHSQQIAELHKVGASFGATMVAAIPSTQKVGGSITRRRACPPARRRPAGTSCSCAC